MLCVICYMLYVMCPFSPLPVFSLSLSPLALFLLSLFSPLSPPLSSLSSSLLYKNKRASMTPLPHILLPIPTYSL